MPRSSEQVATVIPSSNAQEDEANFSSEPESASLSTTTTEPSGVTSSSPSFPLPPSDFEPAPSLSSKSESASPGFESAPPLKRAARRSALELRFIRPDRLTLKEVVWFHERLAALPWVLDDPSRDLDVFASTLVSSPTFALMSARTGSPVGLIWFPHLVPGYSASIAAAVWSREGYGQSAQALDAMRAVARLHKLHHFWTLVVTSNTPGRRAAAKILVRERGTLPEFLCYRGEWYDAVVGGVLVKEIE